MLHDFLPPGEHEALEAILAHHGVTDPALTKHLARLINWVHLEEQVKGQVQPPKYPPYLTVLLGQMGIYSRKEASRA